MKKDKNKKLEIRQSWIKRTIPFGILVLIIAGFIAYSNSFDTSFHWDDFPQIIEKESVHDPISFLSMDAWKKVNFRPFSQMTFALNYAAGGEKVGGYHLVNLLLHILTAFIVFLLTRFTIGRLTNEEKLDQRFKDISSLFVALIFLLHPVQTMAVTYIVQRMTVLAALFYVLAVFLYAQGRILYLDKTNKRKAIMLIALAILSGVVGVLSKQNAASFPGAFILYEIFFIRKANGSLCKKYIISSTSALVLLFVLVFISGYLPAENSNFSRFEYLSAQLGVAHKYILLLLFPVSQNADYFIRVEPPLFAFAQFAGMAILIGGAGLGIYLFKQNRLISFGIFWFLITMSIESSIIPIRDIIMEHRLYLPLYGFGLIIAGIIMQYIPYKSRTGMQVAGILILLLLTIGTYNRNKVWKTELSLWKDCVDKNPDNPRAMNNYGLALKINADYAPTLQQRNMELKKSITYFTNSIKGDTIFVQAYLNRSLAWFELGDYNRALSDMNTVAQERPKEEYLKYYIEGVALAKQGSVVAAAEKLDKSVRLRDDFAQVYTWRGLVYSEMKEYQKALDNYLKSLKLDPKQSLLFINVSNMYYYLRNYEQALKWIKKARDAGEQVDAEYVGVLERQVKGIR